MQLSVIIVNYNVRFYLQQCLLSLRKALQDIDAEVIVFDNHSHDGSVESLRHLFPEVKFINCDHNLGFTKANNRAILQSSGKYILLLNPDTIVADDTIKRAVRFMEQHPKAGGAGVRMKNPDGTDAKESRRGIPTPFTAFCKFTGICNNFPHNKRLGRYYMGWLSWDQEAKIEIISGAFFLLRREALPQGWALDEDFFMYGEDIDLSYRLLKSGWENWYLPYPILHYKGESTQKTSFRYVHVFYEAMLIFFKKHYHGPSRLLLLPVHLAVDTKALCSLLSIAFQRTRKSLGFTRHHSVDSCYIFIVKPEHTKQCQQLVARKGLWAVFYDANDSTLAPIIPSMKKQQVYVALDSGIFSYGQMINIMSSHYQGQASLAIYHPENKMLITDQEVIIA